jgi:serine/threonine protein kinase/Flp pilus assembly protein TadD
VARAEPVLEAILGMSSTFDVTGPETTIHVIDPLIGRILAERYRLLSKLGEGGMGAVYKGEHVKIGRLTAIKILASDLSGNPDFIARFRREAKMASRINHPNAVAIYDFGETDDGLLYIAMELLDGETLSDTMKRTGAMPLDRVLNITRQGAQALEAAHQIGIVHRDFKRDNVMISQKTGWRDWAVVLDFGIAKQTCIDSDRDSLTLPGFILGTPRYMSPEQVKGEKLDARSDLYSLATVTYEMLSGVLPFQARTPQEIIVKRVYEHPRPLLSSRPHLAIPMEVEASIMKALSRERCERHESLAEFAADLEKATHAVVAVQSSPLMNESSSRSAAAVSPPFDERSPVAPSHSPRARVQIGVRPGKPAPVRVAKRTRKLAVAVIALMVAAVTITLPALQFLASDSSSTNLAASLRSAVKAGRLVTLTDDDAYSYYIQLRALNTTHRALNEIAPKVLPQLRIIGEEVLNKKSSAKTEPLTERDWIRTVRAYEWARALSSSDKALEARWRFAQAEIARSKGKKDEERQGYDAAVQADASWPLPLQSLGSLSMEEKRYSHALAQFQRAIDLQPEWEIPYNDLGAAYALLRNYDGAVYWYRRAVDLNPKWAHPHCGLGTAYEQKEMIKEATAEYLRALTIDSNGYSLTSDERTSIQKKLKRLQIGKQ